MAKTQGSAVPNTPPRVWAPARVFCDGGDASSFGWAPSPHSETGHVLFGRARFVGRVGTVVPDPLGRVRLGLRGAGWPRANPYREPGGQIGSLGLPAAAPQTEVPALGPPWGRECTHATAVLGRTKLRPREPILPRRARQRLGP